MAQMSLISEIYVVWPNESNLLPHHSIMKIFKHTAKFKEFLVNP